MSPTAELVQAGAVELVVDGEPFGVPPALEQRIDEIWTRELEARPGIVNGTIVCLGRVEGSQISVRLAEYRLFVARERDASVREQLGLRAIGVSGMLISPDGETVLGRRADDVTEYPGAWELVPSGSLGNPPAPDGRIDALDALFSELEEETGIGRDAVAEALPIGLVHDVGHDGFDVCYGLRLSHNLAADALSSDEYGSLTSLPVADAIALVHSGDPVVPTSLVLLALTGRG